VRELRNTLERAILFCSGDELPLDALEFSDSSQAEHTSLDDLMVRPYQDAKKAFERRFCTAHLRMFNGVKTRAAKHAQVDRSTFYEMMRRCGVMASDVDSKRNDADAASE